MTEQQKSLAWVYIRNREPGFPSFYTVGFYDPNGNFHSDSDFDSRDEARERVHYLNGGAE